MTTPYLTNKDQPHLQVVGGLPRLIRFWVQRCEDVLRASVEAEVVLELADEVADVLARAPLCGRGGKW